MTISTAQYLAMRSQLRAALSGGGSYSASLGNPSDAELNNIVNQLVTDSSGIGVAANVAAGCASAARSKLGGALASALNPSDQDVIDFFAQLKTDATGAAAPATARYNYAKDLLRSMFTSNTPGVPNPSLADMLGYIANGSGGGGGFTGDFGSIFTTAGLTVTHYLRSDLGLTKTGSVVNSWAAQIGPTIAEGSAGVGIGNVTTGLGGHAGIASNGTTQYGKYTLALAAPGTTPTHFWLLGRLLALPSGFGYVDAQGTNAHTLYVNTGTTDLRWQNSSLVFPVTMALNTWGCLETAADNSANCYLKFGAGAALVGNPGNLASAGLRGLFAQENGAGPGSFEVLAIVRCTGTLASFQTAAATAKTQAQSYFSGAVT